MESYVGRRLELMGDRVIDGIGVCQGILERIREGYLLSDADHVAIEKLKLSMDRLQKEIQSFTFQHKGSPSQDMEDLIAELTSLHIKADEILVELDSKLHKETPAQSNIKSNEPHFSGLTNITSRLPQLDLPKFDGNVLSWHEFWSKFTASVDGRKDLSDVDKLTYLQLAIAEGKAKDLLAGLATTQETYAIAVDTLMDEYGEKGIVIDAHYSALFSVPKANQEFHDNKRVLTEIDRHLRILDALGENTGQNNALRALIVAKFSNEVQSNLRMKLKPTQETVINIMNALKTIIKALEHHSAPSNNNSQPSGSTFTTEALYTQSAGNGPLTKQNQNNKRKKFIQRSGKIDRGGNKLQKTNGSFMEHRQKATKEQSPKQFNTRNGNPPRQLRCIFCQGNHTNDLCRQYKNVKMRKSKLLGKCFICLKDSHSAQNCPNPNIFCAHCGMKGHYNRCICPTKYGSESALAIVSQNGFDTVLQTALVPIQTEAGAVVKAKALFDCGSQKSYINASLAKKLKLTPTEKISLTVFTFGSTKPKSIPADLVTINVTCGMNTVHLTAYVVPSTTGLLPSHNDLKTRVSRKYPMLAWAEDSEDDRSADLIVGNDFYYKFILPNRKEIANNLYIIKTAFGWILSGSFDSKLGTVDHQLSVLTYVEGGCVCNNGDLFIRPDPAIRFDEIKTLWELDAIGIKDSPKIVQDEEVIEYFNKTITFDGTRYYVKWPWVEYPPDITPNYGMALGRLQSLLKRLDFNQRQRYNDVLQDQLQKGIIEEITDFVSPKLHPVHYLPHHCVIQEHKSTKLRIVYDGSSKIKGQNSLNELLYKGPLMLEDLTTLILKFRSHAIAMVADIEKAFLQVGLHTEDRDVTRFLWVKNLNQAPSGDNIIQLRFCRVPFGIISSPFLLAATIRHHILRKNGNFAKELASCLYVDNLITGVSTRKEAYALYESAVQTLNELSMNLRGWNSNDKTVLKSMPLEQRDTNDITSVLGITWDTVHDELKLAFSESKLDKPVNTKREVLRVIASVFDPCGFVAPLTLPTRIFLQSLWKKGLKWDTCLSHEQKMDWENCVHSLKQIPLFSTPRWYMDLSEEVPVDLHCFVDASQDAYVAVIYIRTASKVSFVISKSRITPLKGKESLTIPKLELLAVVIGTRLLKYVREALNILEIPTYLWSDNQAVLGWIHTERLLPPWVSRRVGEIHKTKNIQFRYVPSALNPADVATRPLHQDCIPKCWMDGPDFLHQPIPLWPSQQANVGSIDDTLTEDITEPQVETSHHVSTYVSHTNSSEWHLPNNGVTLPVPVILEVQQTHFPNEVAGKATNLSRTLGTFLDEHGVLRCKGRYQNATLPYDQRCPILLPKFDDLTTWVIRRLHIENYHVGVAHTLSLLRQVYWVPQGRSAVSKVLRKCPECVKYGGGPFKLPDMPDLPAERLSYSPPFTYTGLDYLGPLIIDKEGVKLKRWVCLFTCMAVRAVHLEVVDDLSASEFGLCLRRFIASRGLPKLLFSDNASQFKLIASILTSTSVQETKIDWRFITELSPWQGGLYERLIGLVKHCLTRTVDKCLLGDSQLLTVMKEIEAVINTRPLTTVGPDNEMVLTPSHFLRTCGPPSLQPPNEETTLFRTDIQRRVVEGWKRTNHLLTAFQRMFIGQYLLSLRERHCPTHKQPRVLSYRQPGVGDIVQVKGDTKNRALWKVGTIVELCYGTDGQVRSAKVKQDTGGIIHRSVGHLYPLELQVGHVECPVFNPPDILDTKAGPKPVDTLPVAEPPSTPATDLSSTGVISQRPQRAAAQRARQRWRAWTAALFSLASFQLRTT